MNPIGFHDFQLCIVSKIYYFWLPVSSLGCKYHNFLFYFFPAVIFFSNKIPAFPQAAGNPRSYFIEGFSSFLSDGVHVFTWSFVREARWEGESLVSEMLFFMDLTSQWQFMPNHHECVSTSANSAWEFNLHRKILKWHHE